MTKDDVCVTFSFFCVFFWCKILFVFTEMANQRSLTDEQIEQFLSRADDNDDLESDLSEIGSDTEAESVGNTTISNEETDVDEDDIPSKMVYILSSCNEQGTINPKTNKPSMVEFYNSTKGGVDTFDQMCSVMSCSRKTNRWPLCQFFGILNISFINSYIIYAHNMLQDGKKPLTRVSFMKNLFSGLIKNQLADRLEMPTITSNLRKDIQNQLQINNSTDSGKSSTQNQTRKRKICAVCPSSKRRMTNVVCAKCQKRLCGEHKIEVCDSCFI